MYILTKPDQSKTRKITFKRLQFRSYPVGKIAEKQTVGVYF